MQDLPLAALLLALAICAVWLPSLRLSNAFTIPVWLVFFLGAVLTALSARYLKPIGAFALLITTASLYYIDRAPAKFARGLSRAPASSHSRQADDFGDYDESTRPPAGPLP